MFEQRWFVRVVRLALPAIVATGVLAPQSAFAQQSESWKFSLAPLYFWATSIDGTISTRTATVPVTLQFEDATDHLAGAFSFHFEAEKKKVGIFSDLTFVRLSTESAFTLETTTPVIVNGDAEIRDTFFEGGMSYRLSDSNPVAVIGGLRVFTVGAEVAFNTANVSLAPIDGSRTAVSVFGGLTYRPALGSKVTLVSRADIGGGSGMSWAAELGLEYRPAPWAGLVFGYRAIGVNLGDENDDHDIRKADLTFYGPVFGLNLHWGGRP